MIKASVDIHVDIHENGQRFIHVEITGKLNKKHLPFILKGIAEDLENGKEFYSDHSKGEITRPNLERGEKHG